MNKLKILFLTRWYPNDRDLQLGVFVEKHARAVASFAEVRVIAAFPGETAGKRYRIEEISENQYHSCVVYYRKSGPLMAIFHYFLAMQQGIKMMVRTSGKPDLIHAHVLLRPFVLAFLLSKRWRIPFFITEHWTGYIHGAFQRKFFLYKELTRYLFQKAAGVSVVSSSLIHHFQTHRLRNADLRIIPNVVDFPAELVRIPNEGVLRILTVADLADANKNISGVIRVLASLTDKLPEFQYHIVGGGDDEQELKKLAASFLSLKGRVIFHGRVPNEQVYGFMLNSDFLIVNSRVETFSVATAEAIGSGLPVIATRSGGPEFFVSQVNGILIPVDDDEALRQAILEMAHTCTHYNPILMRQYIEERFSASSVAAQFKQLYLDHLKD